MIELSAEEWTVLWLSVKVGLVATAAALPFAIGTAWLLARKRFPGHALLNVVVHLPLVLPPVVTGWLLLLGFGRRGPIGSALEACCGIVFSFRWTGAALAAAVMAFPLMVRAIRIAIEAVEPQTEQAARTLGAKPWQVFLLITLPLSLSGIVAGATLGFAKALGEFGATITFVSNIPGETRTLAAAIYTYTQVPGGDGPTLRLAALSVAVSVGALLVSETLARRAAKRAGRNDPERVRKSGGFSG